MPATEKKNDKPTIVIGCGAHHIPYHYRFLETALQNAGYIVKTVQLPSTSPRVIDSAMWKDVEAIRWAVGEEARRDREVVLVLHSWSGFVGTAAMEGMERWVRHVVYLASWMQKSEVGSCEWLGVDEIGIYEVKDGLNYVREPRQKFYNDLSDELAQDAMEYLLPMVNSVTKEPLRVPPVWQTVPCTYVICQEDEAIPPAFAEMMIRELRVEGEVVRIPGGHSPFLGCPERLARIVRRAAGERVEVEGVKVDGEKLF